MPDEPYADDKGKEEGRGEPLSFLHPAEQEKVQKLVSQYQKIGDVEVGVQTDNVKKPSKEVGVQMNGNNQ